MSTFEIPCVSKLYIYSGGGRGAVKERKAERREHLLSAPEASPLYLLPHLIELELVSYPW